MRVISGTARGRKLETIEGLSTRPTTEKVKEAVMSAIHFDIENSVVLDLFSGSGQLGIETLSRGAKMCVFVDNSRECQDTIKRNLQATSLIKQARVVCMEAEDFLKSTNDRFDIAFLDPPYNQGIILKLSEMLVLKMSDTGIIVCETSRDETMPENFGDYILKKPYKFGTTVVWIYRKQVEDI